MKKTFRWIVLGLSAALGCMPAATRPSTADSAISNGDYLVVSLVEPTNDLSARFDTKSSLDSTCSIECSGQGPAIGLVQRGIDQHRSFSRLPVLTSYRFPRRPLP